MPQRDQHNASDLLPQAPSSAEQCWNELVAQRLPANLQTQAQVLGAFQRVRELANAEVLLRALLCYVLSRSSLKHLSGWSRLVGATGKVLSAQAWPKRLCKCAPWLLWLSGLRPGTYQRHGVVIADGKRLSVRLIAVVLPDEQAEALRRQKQRQARDKGRELSEQALFLAGFHLLVTTLPEQRWPVSLVLELYRCRWQIEILFKRIKQVLDTHRLRCRCPLTAQAMIAALLVAWQPAEQLATRSVGLFRLATGRRGLVESTAATGVSTGASSLVP